jgi:hypothetical protein
MPCNAVARWGDTDHETRVKAKETAYIYCNVDGKEVTIRFTDVYYVPGWEFNIVSYSRLAQHGIDVLFRKNDIRLEKDGQIIAYLDVSPTQKLPRFRLIDNSIKTYVTKANLAATDVFTKYTLKAFRDVVIDENKR